MIKNSHKQTGSAHVVIVTGLILVLVGTLGFIFWQNLMTQKDNTTDPIVKQNETSESVVTTEDLKSLSISEFGVTIQYSDELPDITYSIEMTDLGTRYADLKSISLVSDKCVDDEGSIAQVIKNSSDDEDQRGVVDKLVLGDSMYALALSGDNCANDTSLLENFHVSLKAHFKSLKTD